MEWCPASRHMTRRRRGTTQTPNANALRDAIEHSARSRVAKCVFRKFSSGRALFAEYYAKQRVTRDAGDFAAFTRALDEPLPVTFRADVRAKAGGRCRQVDEFIAREFALANMTPNASAIEGMYDAPCVAARAPTERAARAMERASSSGRGSRMEVVSAIPVCALDPPFGARVLDACASPGSKTMQLLARVVEDEEKGETSTSAGVVHANDANPGRARTLIDVVERHNRSIREMASLVVTRAFGQDLNLALFAPGGDLRRARRDVDALDSERDRIDALNALGGYTHVLADVPCSGDGTIRKDTECLKRWNPGIGNALHATQLAVARRCAQILKPGGSMVYSTCTFNPIEDEAVVAALLSDRELALELEPLSALPSAAVSRKGLLAWGVGEHVEMSGVDGDGDGDGEDVRMRWFDSFSDAENAGAKGFASTMWPPPPGGVNLELCARFLPHDMNTGGFFIAKLRKKNDDDVRRAFAATVDAELRERVGKIDASSSARKRARTFVEDVKDAALDRLVPAHRVSKQFSRELSERFGAHGMYSVDVSRRRVYVGVASASAFLDRECGDKVRLARAGCLLLSPEDDDDDDAKEFDYSWDARTVVDDLRLHVAGVRALATLAPKRRGALPASWLAMLPTELAVVVDLGGDVVDFDDFSEQTQKSAHRDVRHGPCVLCLRKKSGDVVFVAPGTVSERGVALAPGIKDASSLARSLREVAKRKTTKATETAASDG